MDFLYPPRILSGTRLPPVGINRAERVYRLEDPLSDLVYTIDGDEITKLIVGVSSPGFGGYADRRYTFDDV